MGLLTDPKKRQRLLAIVARYHTRVSVLLYLAGVVGFAALAHESLSNSCYFSENALLPGLVESEFYPTNEVKDIESELEKEMNKDKNVFPKDWLVRKLREMGLDTFVHNFSVLFPFSVGPGQQLYAGQNVYAILRARRAASTEAVVMSSPLRPLVVQEQSSGGIALMLALAQHFRRQTYWGKDIIFLMNEFDNVGVQAWLDAYHDSETDYIKADELVGRSGAIQAAINLEIPGGRMLHHLDVKIEGLNGQLPNLDLFNLIIRLCRKEQARCTLHNREDPRFGETWKGFQHQLLTMLSMVWWQSSGSPSASHGLFHRFHIEALTLEGVPPPPNLPRHGTLHLDSLARIVEGVYRSLNNLLERFHQSFFFYLLPSTHRYVSIGNYMIPFGLMAAAPLIKAIVLWAGMDGKDKESAKTKDQKKKDSKENEGKTEKKEDKEDGKKEEEEKTEEEKSKEEFVKHIMEVIGHDSAAATDSENEEDEEGPGSGLLSIVPVISICVLLGLLASAAPDALARFSPAFRLRTEDSLTFGLLALYSAALVYPRMISRRSQQPGKLLVDWTLLKCVALLTFSLVVCCIALMNISLAITIATATTPIIIFVQPTQSRVLRWLQRLFLVLVSPPVLVFLSGVVGAVVEGEMKGGGGVLGVLLWAWEATKQTLLLRVLDKYFFGCWTYSVLTAVLFPTWLMFWGVAHCDLR